jgi:membrane protein implicated in regulation of membrane protease activity
MSDPMLWWLLAGSAVVLELLSGTFYLLMIAVGLSAGAIAAHAAVSSSMQMVVSAVAGIGAVVGWNLYRGRHPKAAPAQSNADVNLDIGSFVQIAHASDWREDGSVTVHYRGTDWTGQLAAGSERGAGRFVIEQVQGSVLMLRRA